MANVVGSTMLALLVVVLLSSAFTSSHPIAADKCRTGCHGSTPNNFKYAEGTTYKYNMESSVDISLSTADGQQSATKLKATVLLTQQPQCVQVLRLQNVQVFGGDGKKKGAIPNIDKAIKINFHDGHIEDVICAESGDTQVSLNIKRAAASLFQLALKDDTEIDVFGVCPTTFTTAKDGPVVVHTKTRTLNHCSHRENAKHDFLTTAFNLHSEIRSSPILKSDYTSEMKVKDGILDHVLLTENYLYMPFSIGKNGAKATVQTKLQFVGKSKDAPKNKCTEPKSIIFENPHPLVNEKSDVKTIVEAVKNTANSIKETVSERSAAKFGQLISVMAAGKKDDLLAVYNQVQSGAGFADKEKAKKVFLDALFRTGTGDCLEVSIQLLKSKQLSPLEEKMVYLGMSFIRHATPGSIATAASLLDTPKLPREAYLGIGSLVSHYCKSHDCHNLDQLKVLCGKLLGKLKDGKAANKEQENEMIAALKALTNMKHLADNIVPKLITIATEKKNSMRLRVAALEAFASDMCKDKLRDAAINILKDTQQDAEVRLKAYLALAECPNGKVAKAVKDVLDKEESYQILGFIVSHIRVLRASANPDKELAKRELGPINTARKFPIDPRKFSFFDEDSHSIPSLGTSGSWDTSVIYSQNSFLPRSVCVNLTTEIFGHRMNFLEIDTRQENLDKLMEHYLGSMGAILGKSEDQLMKEGESTFRKIYAKLQERMQKTRGKRHVPQGEIDSMGKATQIKTNDLNNDLDLDLSIKLFGSEFLFLTLNQDAEQFTAEKLIDKFFDSLDKGIEKAKNFQHTYTRNGIFLDVELAYPTSTGFPLKMSVEGTDSLQLIAETKVDIKALLQGSEQSVMSLKLIPSANIQVAGRLTLDASVVESGLKVTSNLHTATGGALNLELFKHGIDAKFNLPIEKQEIINAEHQLVFVTRDAGHAEAETPLKFVESKPLDICFDHLEQVVGLTFCAGLNSPNQQLNQGAFLPFPFNGNSQLKVFITRDKPVTYHLRDIVHDTDKHGVEFVLETLDEAKKPMVSLAVEAFMRPEMYISASLDSPIKKATLEGRIVDTDNELSVGAKFVHDNQEYSGKLGLSVTGNDAKSTYKPLIEFITPENGKQQSPYTVEGQIIAERSGGNSKYTFDNVKLISPSTPTITITGNVGEENGAYFADVKLEDGQNSGTIKGKLAVSSDVIKAEAKVTNTMSPVSNFEVNYELKRDEHSFSNDLTLVHGGDLTNKQNTLKLKNSVTNKYTDPSNYLLETKNHFSYPLIGVDGKLNFKKAPKHLDFVSEGKYNKAKVGAKLNAKYNQKTDGDYDVTFEGEALENKLKGKAKRDINGDVSTIDKSLDINGMKAEVKGTVTHKSKPHDTDIGCDLTIQIPQCPDIISIKHRFSYVPDECKTHLKIAKGAENLVDIDYAGHETKGGNGHIKANIKDVISVDGELKAPNWNGKAHVIVDMPKVQRKIKLDSTFNLAEPKYNFAVNFYPNFEKSPKKISLTSDNEITEKTVDTKNKLDVFENVFEGNFKGGYDDPSLEGKSYLEGDLTLPNGMYFGGKLNRELTTTKDGLINGNAFLNLEQRNNKNAPGRKLTLKGTAKDTNVKLGKIDLVYNLAADDSNGKNLNGDWSIKYNVDGEQQRKGEIAGKLYGSILAEPIEFGHKTEYKHHVGSYSLFTKCKDGSLNVDGKYNLASEDSISGAVNVHLKTSNPKLKSLEFSTNGKFHDDEKADKCEIAGGIKLIIDDDGTDPDATVHFEAEGDVSVGEHNGQVKGTVKVQKLDPVTVALGYGHKKVNDVITCQGDASLKYAQGKTIKADATLTRPNDNEGKLELKLETPFEHMKQSDIVLNYKQSDDGKHATSDLTAIIDGKKYESNTEIRVSEVNPLFKTVLTHDGHTDKVHLWAENPGNHIHKGEINIVHKDGVLFFYSYDMNVPSVEDFKITTKLSIPAAMEPDSIVTEIKNQKNKAIEISITGDGETIVKGTATYKVRDDGGKYIVEGSGEFTVKNDKKTGTFKYIKQQLTMEKNHEVGVAVTLGMTLGSSAIDAETKMTNKQFRIMNSYCQEKNQCQHLEIDSKSNVVNVAEYDNELEIRVELGKYDFGVKSVSKRKQLQYDHTTDIHFQTEDNKKYQYSLYIHPKEAGVSLTTPKRQVALESKIDVPPKFKGPTKFDISFYLDKKNEPTKKTSLSGGVEYTGDEKTGKVVVDTKLSSPGLSKNLVVSYVSKYDVPSRQAETTLTMDIFASQNAKIIATAKSAMSKMGDNGQYDMTHHANIKSVGMGIDITYDEITYALDTKAHTFKTLAKLQYSVGQHKCTCMYLFEASPSKITGKIQLHDKEILSFDSKLKLTKEEQVIDTDIVVLGVKPLTSHYELKNFNTMKYTLASKENPAKQLTINAAFIPGQIADFRADVSNQVLVKASVQLDEANFLKPEYGVDLDGISDLVLVPAKQQIENMVKEGQNIVSADEAAEQAKHISETAKKNVPNLKGVKDYYSNEWNKVTSEIKADPNIQKASEFLHKIFGTFAKLVGEIVSKGVEIMEQLVNTARATIKKFSDALDQQILPELQNTIQSLAKALEATCSHILDIFYGVIAHFHEFLETHQAELKQIATTFSTISQDVARFIQKNCERLKTMVSENAKKLYEEIKALPLYDELQARYELLAKDLGDWTEPLKHMIEDTLNTVQDIIPNEDAKKIVEAIRNYISKKLKNEPVDDIAAIENILRSIVVFVKKLGSQYKINEIPAMSTKSLMSDYLYALPKSFAAKFSWLDYSIVNDEAEFLESIDKTLQTLTFNPEDWIGPPFMMYGYLIQGQHIFTFDGKHLTFPGSCNYLITRDALNGNFTVAGTFANGFLTALTVADATDSITVKKGGQVMHGKQAAEFPLKVGNLEAYRTYENVHVKSKAGVYVKCDPKLVVCEISVDGFYHAQLRGLLGNGNYEPYDDFIVPNGKIVANEADFGNAYKMTGSCKPVTTPNHATHTRAPSCTALFAEPSLKPCEPFINTENFRTACDHGVAAGVKDTEKAIAMGYVKACNTKYLPAVLPQQFMTCTNGDHESKFGEKFSVKLPGKAADIVVIVEQAKNNEQVYKDLVQPMVSDLTKELASKGITDVEYHLVGYSGDEDGAEHYTSGGKLSWKGKLPAMKFAEEDDDDDFKTGNENIDKIIEIFERAEMDIKLALGLDPQGIAFYDSFRYPFRAHATKTIITFNSHACKQGNLLTVQKLRAELFTDRSVQVNLVSPINDFKCKDAKVSKTVVGYDDKHVMTFADAKKKSVGSTELHKDLETDDFCSDWVLKQGGAVFNVDNFLAAKGPQRTQFAQLVSHTLADQIVNTEQALDCECSFRGLGVAKNVCKSVSSNKKEK